MHSIRLERVAFAYSSTVPLLADVELQFTRGFTGIVGENGAGKSTLVALVAGELAPTAGHVRVEPRDALVVRCPQEVDRVPADACTLADRTDADAGRWCALLGLDPGQLDRWSTLSPGERRRWQLAGALARVPDVLLLDEPTNHVDTACRSILVGALRRFRGIGLVISHDREVLDTLTMATVRVHRGDARLYPGGYTAAKATWEAEHARAHDVRRSAIQTADRAAAQLTRARAEHAATDAQRSRSARMKGTKDHDQSAMGRAVVIGWAEAQQGRRVEVARREATAAREAIPEVETMRTLGRSVFVDYERCPRRFVLELDQREVRAGDHVVLGDVKLAVRADDRIHVAGANGGGKTTLVAALLAASTLPDDKRLVVPQELTPEEALALLATTRALPPAVRGRVCSLVAALGVDPDRLLASPSPSPGEARKLALALGLGQQVWCVVLDEPTNHLDLPSIERLEAALAAYPGALVLVSHDLRFASALTTTRWEVRAGRVTVA